VTNIQPPGFELFNTSQGWLRVATAERYWNGMREWCRAGKIWKTHCQPPNPPHKSVSHTLCCSRSWALATCVSNPQRKH